MPVSTAVRTVTFVSPHSQFRAIRRNAIDRMNNEGSMVPVSPEVVYEFSPQGRGKDEYGTFTIEVGRDPLPDAPPFDFETGEGQVQDAVSWLRSFAVQTGRFAEAEEVRQDTAELLRAIAEAELAGDLLLVEQIGDNEWALNYPRDEVMDRVKLARARMTAAIAEPAPKTKAKQPEPEA